MEPDKGWKQKIYIIIFEADTPAGRLFDLVLLWAILLSVFSVILESDTAISQSYEGYLHYIEWGFTILFSIEYGLRILCTPHPLHYIKSFFGIVDLISIAPTYLSLFFPGTQFLLVTRAIRFLRVFRILKLVRYLQESQILIQALGASRYKITIFLGVILTVIFNTGYSHAFSGT